MSMKCPSLSLLIKYGLRSLLSYIRLPTSTCFLIFLENLYLSFHAKIVSNFDDGHMQKATEKVSVFLSYFFPVSSKETDWCLWIPLGCFYHRNFFFVLQLWQIALLFVGNYSLLELETPFQPIFPNTSFDFQTLHWKIICAFDVLLLYETWSFLSCSFQYAFFVLYI